MRPLLAAFLVPLLLPLGAAAQTMRATYEVYAAGMTVLELEARFELGAQAYLVETRMRTRGIAASFVSGEQVSRASGGWDGMAAAPESYLSEGTWRGRTRRIAMAWRDSEPRVVDLVPPNEEDDREPVPPSLRQGTVDALSALAALARHVGQQGSCDVQAPVFDGRRRSDFQGRSEGREVIRPWRGAWHGEALRCGFEGRLVAGFRRDQSRDQAATPQLGTAWIARPYAGAPPVPVRLDIPTRWFGTATAVLLRAEPVAARPAEAPAARDGRRG